MRLIDADALTDRLLNELRKIPGPFDKINGRQAANMIGKRIDEAPTVGDWISVKDRLPEEGECVLVAIDGVLYHQKCVETAMLQENGFCGCGYDKLIYRNYRPIVTHWMPLPEPPEEEI